MFSEVEAKNILLVKIRMGRNIDKEQFTPNHTNESRKHVETLVSNFLESLKGDLQGKYHTLGHLSEEESKSFSKEQIFFG